MCVRVVNVRGVSGRPARQAVCYVGRAWAGWPTHALANPFRMKSIGAGGASQSVTDEWNRKERERVLAEYRKWLTDRPAEQLEGLLADLWAECERGEKPLGCWCTSATAGDGSALECHAQVLAELLRERFCTEAA